jgi:hypothetical protein
MQSITPEGTPLMGKRFPDHETELRTTQPILVQNRRIGGGIEKKKKRANAKSKKASPNSEAIQSVPEVRP